MTLISYVVELSPYVSTSRQQLVIISTAVTERITTMKCLKTLAEQMKILFNKLDEPPAECHLYSVIIQQNSLAYFVAKIVYKFLIFVQLQVQDQQNLVLLVKTSSKQMTSNFVKTIYFGEILTVDVEILMDTAVEDPNNNVCMPGIIILVVNMVD